MSPSAREAHRRAQARYQWTAKGRVSQLKAHRKDREVHADRATARKAISNAIRDGRLGRPETCETCGASCRPEAHHYMGYDVANHFSVQWLCSSCHRIAEGS